MSTFSKHLASLFNGRYADTYHLHEINNDYYIEIGNDRLARVTLQTTGVHERYDAIKVEIITKNVGTVCSQLFHFRNYFLDNRKFPCCIEGSMTNADWSAVNGCRILPTYDDRMRLTNAVSEFLHLFR